MKWGGGPQGRRAPPLRTCAACRQQGGKRDLLRFVRGSDGAVTFDRTGRAPGRGAYLHATAECFEIARKRKALDRALGAAAPLDLLAGILPTPG